MTLLIEAVVFLAAAVLVVPLFRRFGLGAILGYLAAGVVIGPNALGLIPDAEEVLHFAEFGVVLLLFIIGLELQPGRLWVMRHAVFGLGTAQVTITALLIGGLAQHLPAQHEAPHVEVTPRPTCAVRSGGFSIANSL